MTFLTGEEWVLVYGGSVGDGGYGGEVRPVSPRFQVRDIDGTSSNPQFVRIDGGAPTITLNDFRDLPEDDQTVHIALASGGVSFTLADFIDYVHRTSNPGPGIMIDVAITKRGKGYAVGDFVSPAMEAGGANAGAIRILEIDHFGGIVRAKLTGTNYFPDGPHPTVAEVGDGAEVFVTTRRDTVSGVIWGYGPGTGGDDWRINDPFILTSPDAEDASGIVYQTDPPAIPGVELISVYRGETCAITSGTQETGVVLIAGDKTGHLPIGRRVLLVDSTDNDGAYFVSARSFGTGHTSLTLKGPPNGTITLSDLPSDGDTATVGAATITFRSASPGANEVLIGADVTETASSLASALLAQYAEGTLIIGSAAGVVTITCFEASPLGEAFSLAKSGTNIAVSGANLEFQTALPDATMDGNIILPCEIVVKANNYSNALDPNVKWRFTGVFDESDLSKRLDGLDAGYNPVASGDPARPDQYTLYISIYSSGANNMLPTIDLAMAVGNIVGAVEAVDLYVFGTTFVPDTYAMEGPGSGAAIEVGTVIGFPAP